MSPRRTALAATALAALAALAPCAQAAGRELAPYEALARGSGAARVLEAAREGLREGLGDTLDAPPPAPDWPAAPRPVFVTLVAGHATRACLGSDEPLGTLGETVRRLAARVLTDDRRRAPVRADELDSLRVVVAFAGEPVPVGDPWKVNPAREGLRIESDAGAVAFLPGEARTVSWALAEARRVGVLRAGDEARWARFDVVVIAGAARGAAPGEGGR